MGKIFYCEKCGNICSNFIGKTCDFCAAKMKILPEDMQQRYKLYTPGWEKFASKLDEVDTIEEDIEIREKLLSKKIEFIKKELSGNPLFSEAACKNQLKREREKNAELTELNRKNIEERHAKKVRSTEIEIGKHDYLMTTGYEFKTHDIISYLGVINGNAVLGTGFLSELFANTSDIFGTSSNAFSKKLDEARERAKDELIKKSSLLGGNAIIGVDFDYMMFSNNMIGVVITGTSVVVEKI